MAQSLAKRWSFQAEFRALLRRHEIEFDERYLWDSAMPAIPRVSPTLEYAVQG
jgi:hypothetical protein